MSTPEPMRPEQMRTAVARYVEEIHRAYVAQALTFPAAVRGRMPLLAPGPLTVAAVGARNLHVLATRDSLGPVRAPEVELAGAVAGLEWTLRFFDPVVLPELALIDESGEPAFAEVRHALGVRTVVYHFVASPGAGLSAHQAAHVGTGLAGGHSAAARAAGRGRRADAVAAARGAGVVTTGAAPGGGLSTVRNAARLLKVFRSREADLGVSELARRLGLGKSTVHRMLTTLVA